MTFTRIERLRRLARRLRRPNAWEQALDEELRACVEQDVEARIAAGVSPVEARRQALAEFGGIEPVKEQVRTAVSGAGLRTLVQDVRYGVRALRQAPAFTAWVAGSLAIGMAVAIAAFAFLLALFVGPFPAVHDQSRLVRVAMLRRCGPDCSRRLASDADLAALRDASPGLQGVSAYTAGQVAVGIPAARTMRAVLASEDYFQVLGATPVLGRPFGAADGPGQPAVAVIAYRVWKRDFEGDPAIVGRTIRVGEELVQIAGVAPEFFVGVDLRPARGDRGPDLWLPLWLADRVLPPIASDARLRPRDLSFVGRLAPGVTAAAAEAQARVVAQRQIGASGAASGAPVAQVRRVWISNPENWGIGALVLMPVPILVLAIACLNAANLMLARGSQRRRELAIRLAIGASRGRIVRQLLIESALLASLATAIAVPVAWWSVQSLSSPLAIPIGFNPLVLTFTLLAGILTTLVFGLLPAIRVSAQPPSSTLGPVGAHRDATPQQSRARRALLLVQVALSVALLASGSQLVSTVRSQAVSGGTAGNRLLIAGFNLGLAAGPAAREAAFYDALIDRASRLPGVESAGLARTSAVWTFGQGAAARSLTVWDSINDSDNGRVMLGGYAGGDLFEAVGLRVLAGRGFEPDDRAARPQVAIVNDAYARLLQAPPIGRVLRVAPRGTPSSAAIDVRIVGVIESAREPRLESGPPAAAVYLPSPIEPEPALSLYVRTGVPAATVAQPLRELVSDIAPRIPLAELGTLDEINERSYGPQLWLARAAAVLGLIGLLLASAGLYGVASYVVTMRTREIAIRMAIGARPAAILGMLLGQSMTIAVVGLIAGSAIALGASAIIQSEYHGIIGIDGAVFAGAAALFVTLMLAASLQPAIRAARLDPVETLRDG